MAQNPVLNVHGQTFHGGMGFQGKRYGTAGLMSVFPFPNKITSTKTFGTICTIFLTCRGTRRRMTRSLGVYPWGSDAIMIRRSIFQYAQIYVRYVSQTV